MIPFVQCMPDRKRNGFADRQPTFYRERSELQVHILIHIANSDDSLSHERI